MVLKLLKWGGMASGATALAVGTYLLAIQLTGNFSEVIPGELYRSNQPTASEIADYARRYGIKTIINLRGDTQNAPWYTAELAAAAALGVNHIDFGMSAGKQLTLEGSRRLVALLREAPKPILLHCKSGSDRTGLVSAIYMREFANVDNETAEGQLSIRFGHFGIPFLSPTYAMDENWEKLEELLPLSG